MTLYRYEVIHEWAGGRWQLLWSNVTEFADNFPYSIEMCTEPNTGLWHNTPPPYQVYQVWVYYPKDGQWSRSQVESNWLGGPHTCFG